MKTSWMGWMWVGLVAASALGAGCARSRPARYYLLEPVSPTAEVTTAATRVIVLAPVQVAGYLDRRPWVSRTERGELRVHEFERWAQPLADNLADVVTANLRALGGLDVVAFDHTGLERDHALVRLKVSRFEPDPRGQIVLDVAWEIRRGQESRHGHRVYEVPIQNARGTSAYNEALAQWSRDLHAELIP